MHRTVPSSCGIADRLDEVGAGRIVRHRPTSGAIPRNIVRGAAHRGEIGGGEEAAGVGPHQERAVRPVADEVAIVPALREHDGGQSQRERAVGARTHAQPLIRPGRRPRAPRVHYDQGRSARSRMLDGGGLRQVGGGRVVPPEQEAAGALEVGRADIHAEGERRDEVTVPGAQLLAPHQVRAPEGADETEDPEEAVGDRGAGGRGAAEGHALGPVPPGDLAHP